MKLVLIIHRLKLRSMELMNYRIIEGINVAKCELFDNYLNG